MTFRGKGMPLDDSARFDVGPNDFHRFNLGEVVEVNRALWVVTRLNTVVGTVDLTPMTSWDEFKKGLRRRSVVQVPDEYGRVEGLKFVEGLKEGTN